MNDWLAGLRELGQRGEAAALVTVIRARGSTPREAGAKMTVGMQRTWDSIGGGQLEHAAIESARLALEGGDGYGNTVEHYKLGPALGQCCGGATALLIECIPAGHEWIDSLEAARRDNATAFVATAVGGRDKRVLRRDAGDSWDGAGQVAPLLQRAEAAGTPVLDKAADGSRWFVDPVTPVNLNIVLFGAGHVGRALVAMLSALPGELTWIDGRRDQFPGHLPANVRTRTVREPEALVDDCASGAFYLVMTHSHPLDLAICERILKRDDFAYCGLIGSVSKRRHFEKRLRLKGVTETALNRLTCPIGIDGIGGKRPAEIAVAVAAQILQVRESIQAGGRREIPSPASRPPGSARFLNDA